MGDYSNPFEQFAVPNVFPLDITDPANNGDIVGIVSDPTLSTDVTHLLHQAMVNMAATRTPGYLPPGFYWCPHTNASNQVLTIPEYLILFGASQPWMTGRGSNGVVTGGSIIATDTVGIAMDGGVGFEGFRPWWIQGITLINRNNPAGGLNLSTGIATTNPSGGNNAWNTYVGNVNFGANSCWALADTATVTVMGSNEISTTNTTWGGLTNGNQPCYGSYVTGTNIPAGATVTQILDATHLLISAPCTGSATVTATFNGWNAFQVGYDQGGTVEATVEKSVFFVDARNPNGQCGFYCSAISATEWRFRDSDIVVSGNINSVQYAVPIVVDGAGVACKIDNVHATNNNGDNSYAYIAGAQQLHIKGTDMENALGGVGGSIGTVTLGLAISTIGHNRYAGGNPGQNDAITVEGCQLGSVLVQNLSGTGGVNMLTLRDILSTGPTVDLVVNATNVNDLRILQTKPPAMSNYLDSWPNVALEIDNIPAVTVNLSGSGSSATYAVPPGIKVVRVTVAAGTTAPTVQLPDVTASIGGPPPGYIITICNVVASAGPLAVTNLTSGGTVPSSWSSVAAGTAVRVVRNAHNYEAG